MIDAYEIFHSILKTNFDPRIAVEAVAAAALAQAIEDIVRLKLIGDDVPARAAMAKIQAEWDMAVRALADKTGAPTAGERKP